MTADFLRADCPTLFSRLLTNRSSIVRARPDKFSAEAVVSAAFDAERSDFSLIRSVSTFQDHSIGALFVRMLSDYSLDSRARNGRICSDLRFATIWRKLFVK